MDYAELDRDPLTGRESHFGVDYALTLGYDESALLALPSSVVDRFAGVGNPHAHGMIQPGMSIVDIGCGAGTDLLLAAEAVGPTGRVLGIDEEPKLAMRARAGMAQLGVGDRGTAVSGSASDLPVPTGSVHVVMTNGLLMNLEDIQPALNEMFRVLLPGGVALLAELVGPEGLSAMDLLEAVSLAGFDDISFEDGTPNPKGLQGMGANIIIKKPYGC